MKPKTTVTHYARIKRDAKKTHPDVRKFLAPVAQMSRTSKRAPGDQMPLSMVRRPANGERKIGISGSVRVGFAANLLTDVDGPASSGP